MSTALTARRPGPVWDPGLQPERTSLAWQRTWLALLSAGLIAARLVGHYHLAVGIAIVGGAVVLAAALAWTGSRRYADVHRRLHADVPLGNGGFNLLLLGSFLLVGIGGLAYAWLVTR